MFAPTNCAPLPLNISLVPVAKDRNVTGVLTLPPNTVLRYAPVAEVERSLNALLFRNCKESVVDIKLFASMVNVVLVSTVNLTGSLITWSPL